MLSSSVSPLRGEKKQRTVLRVTDRFANFPVLLLDVFVPHFFMGKTLTDAMTAARVAHPQRKAFAVRVGHKCAIEIGGVSR